MKRVLKLYNFKMKRQHQNLRCHEEKSNKIRKVVKHFHEMFQIFSTSKFIYLLRGCFLII